MIDAAAAEVYLRPRLPEADGRFAIAPLGGGQSNPTFRVTFGDRAYVLRKQPAGALLPSAHAVDREYRVLRALAATDVPVPRTYLFCDDRAIVGTPFFVMDHVPGRTLWDPAMPDLDPRARALLWDDANRVIAALHRVDYAAIGLADYGRPGNYFARQIARWTRQYRASETERIDAMDRLIDWLPGAIPDDDETTLVHGDYRLDNLLVHPVQPRIVAVLDWELSTLGHPLADLAYHVMAWRLTKAEFRGMAGRDLAALGIPSEHEYVETYCRHAGRGPIERNDWEFCMAFSMFRLAAILQGIARRAIDGTSASADAVADGARARGIAQAAWRQVMHAAAGPRA